MMEVLKCSIKFQYSNAHAFPSSFPQGPAGLKGGEGPQGPPGPVVSTLLTTRSKFTFKKKKREPELILMVAFLSLVFHDIFCI